MSKNNLITSNFHLPYNKDLIPRAKELRKNMTSAERKLWDGYLIKFSFRILRQKPIDNFIVDFYCAKLKLVIEIDGDSHLSPQAKISDRERTNILEGYGLKVIRFTNYDVFNNFDIVCQQIDEFFKSPPFKGGFRGISSLEY